MSDDLRAKIDNLVPQWREKARYIDLYHATMSSGWKVCADELEAALSAASSQNEPRPISLVLRRFDAFLNAVGLTQEEFLTMLAAAKMNT